MRRRGEIVMRCDASGPVLIDQMAVGPGTRDQVQGVSVQESRGAPGCGWRAGRNGEIVGPPRAGGSYQVQLAVTLIPDDDVDVIACHGDEMVVSPDGRHLGGR